MNILIAVALVMASLSLILASWAVFMLRRLPDAVVSKLDGQILEVADAYEPQPRDGDRFSRPAPLPWVSNPPMSHHLMPPDGMTHAQREEHTLRKGVPGWHGLRVRDV